jgi:hypothetical protein
VNDGAGLSEDCISNGNGATHASVCAWHKVPRFMMSRAQLVLLCFGCVCVPCQQVGCLSGPKIYMTW